MEETAKNRIIDYLRTHPAKPMSYQDVVKAMPTIDPQTVQSVLSRAFYDGKLDREKAGKGYAYRFIAATAPRQHPGGRRKQRANGKAPPVSLTIRGVTMTLEEGLEVMGALSKLFDRITVPKA